MRDVISILQFVRDEPAVWVALFFCLAIIAGIFRDLIITGNRYQDTVKALEREVERHDKTRNELRENTRQIERMSDGLNGISTSLASLPEIRRTLTRIEENLRGRDND